MRPTQAVIIGGGLGTRLTDAGIMTPKLLLNIDGLALFEHQLSAFSSLGIKSILFLLGNNSDEIMASVLASKIAKNFEVIFSIENAPLGTGGALVNAADKLHETFYFVYGDILFDTNLDHMAAKLLDADGVILTRSTDHMLDSDLIEVDITGLVTRLNGKPHDAGSGRRNRANTGVYLFRREIALNLKSIFHESKFDLDREGINSLLLNGTNLYASNATGFIRDIGTAQRLQSACLDWPHHAGPNSKVPTIFLDRDGVINKPNGHIKNVDEFIIYEDSIQAIRLLRSLGFRIIVITNQPVLSRGDLTWEGLELIHGKLDELLALNETFIDAYFVCPHYPLNGFEGEVAALKIDCSCRKPKPGLIYEAIENFPIDFDKSWFVGDQLSDFEAARSVGIKFVGVGHDLSDAHEFPWFDSLMEFASNFSARTDTLSK